MTGRGYLRSAEVAGAMGAYDRYEENREPHNAVMRTIELYGTEVVPVVRELLAEASP